MSCNVETEQQSFIPGINKVLTPEQIELYNSGLYEVLVYYTTYPKHFFRDLLTTSRKLYTYVVNIYFNNEDESESESEDENENEDESESEDENEDENVSENENENENESENEK